MAVQLGVDVATDRAALAARNVGFLITLASVASYAIFAALLYGLHSPLTTTALPDGGSGDPAQMAWFLSWTPFALGHGFSLLHSSFIDAPGGINLANNTSVPLLGFIGAPITHLFGPIATINFLFRAAFLCSATSMYFVLRSFCPSRWCCYLGGLVYGFGPFLINQGQANAHLNLAFVPLPPLLVWCAYDLLVRRNHRPLPIAILGGAAAGGQFLISPEILSDLVIVVVPASVVYAVARRRLVAKYLTTILPAMGAAIVVFLAVSSFVIANLLFGAGHVGGAVQPAAHLQTFASDLLSPLIPNDRQAIAPHALTTISRLFAARNQSEQGGYLGIGLIAVFLFSAIALRKDRIIRACVVFACIAFVFSLGSELFVAHHRSGMALPEAVLVHLPLLKNTTPARFSLDVMLFVAIVGARATNRVMIAWESHRRPRIAMLGAGAVLVLLPLFPRLALTTSPTPWTSSMINLLVATTPRESLVLTYPYPSPPFSQAMLWQAQAHMSFRLMGGYATVRNPDGAGQYWPDLLSPPSVQEYLNFEEAGTRSHYPAPTQNSAGTTTDLCRYIATYGIDSVVLWTHAPHAPVVEHYFASALGAPSVQALSLVIWSGARARVAKAAVCRK